MLTLPIWCITVIQVIKFIITVIEKTVFFGKNGQKLPENNAVTQSKPDLDAQVASLRLTQNEVLDYLDRLNKRVATRQARGEMAPAEIAPPPAKNMDPEELRVEIARKARGQK